MNDTPQKTVEQAYDNIAGWYLAWVEGQRSPRERYTDKVLQNATANAPSADTSPPRILELGAGAGVPITRMLLDRGAQVVANDISAKQLELAAARCPEATLVPGDMATLDFEAASFDGAVAFYSVFHLPRQEQRTMLAKIHAWLRPGAMLAFNLATMDEEEIHGEFMGYGMFWSSYAVADSVAMVKEAGFEAVEAEELEAGDGKLGESDADFGVKFLWITAKK
ncbi:S-adenosyl-L-methionine-dependent methyltransferase [Apiospora phragmitis]|uniref:S-adenosyl-L-methionine-dependent methyltransferase n=1 Tax=Apiospora phragmitis TaxID=2905665 RepID=A0ABR1VSS0_9PEZI